MFCLLFCIGFLPSEVDTLNVLSLCFCHFNVRFLFSKPNEEASIRSVYRIWVQLRVSGRVSECDVELALRIHRGVAGVILPMAIGEDARQQAQGVGFLANVVAASCTFISHE